MNRLPCGIDRRGLLARSAILLGVGDPVAGLLAACVLDFSLSSDEWEGAFGFVSYLVEGGVADQPTILPPEQRLHARLASESRQLDRQAETPRHTVFAPGLHGAPTRADATERTNVFMNGIEGPGPMNFQPSVFDSDPGDPIWSPYWDHFTYAWREEASRGY